MKLASYYEMIRRAVSAITITDVYRSGKFLDDIPSRDGSRGAAREGFSSVPALRRLRLGSCGCRGAAALAFVALWLVSQASMASSANVQGLDAAINGSQRSAEHKARDPYRHPEQTLEFFGIKPDMTVVEVLPEGGWYTEILAPFLRDHGKLVEASFPENSSNPFIRRMAAHYRQKLEADPGTYGRVVIRAFAPPEYLALGPPDSADMVLTFRNMHDLVYVNPHGQATSAVLDRFFRSAYLALKPGGVLGIVAHRAKPGAAVGRVDRLGRLPQEYLVEHAEQAGFRLQASSEINANPKDPRDEPVWYLSPDLQGPKADRAKYQAIGESDRMTLKFVKPSGPSNGQ